MLSQSWIMVVSFAVRCRHRCKWHGDKVTVARWRWRRGGGDSPMLGWLRIFITLTSLKSCRDKHRMFPHRLVGTHGDKVVPTSNTTPVAHKPAPPDKSTHQRPLKRWCSSLIGCPSSDTRTRRVRAFTFCRLVGFSWVLSMILMATCSGKHKTHHTTASNQVSLFCCNSSSAGEIYRCSSNHYYYQTICNLLSLALAYFKRIQKGSVPYCGHVINCWSFTSFMLIHCGAYCDPWSIMSLFFFVMLCSGEIKWEKNKQLNSLSKNLLRPNRNSENRWKHEISRLKRVRHPPGWNSAADWTATHRKWILK